jgi:hypothetical protein
LLLVSGFQQKRRAHPRARNMKKPRSSFILLTFSIAYQRFFSFSQRLPSISPSSTSIFRR